MGSKYIVGIDPIEKSYNMWEKLLIKLGFKKREFKTTVFEVFFNAEWFKEGDLLDVRGNEYPLKVLSVPKLNFWNKIKKFLGFNFEYSFDVEFNKKPEGIIELYKPNIFKRILNKIR